MKSLVSMEQTNSSDFQRALEMAKYIGLSSNRKSIDSSRKSQYFYHLIKPTDLKFFSNRFKTNYKDHYTYSTNLKNNTQKSIMLQLPKQKQRPKTSLQLTSRTQRTRSRQMTPMQIRESHLQKEKVRLSEKLEKNILYINHIMQTRKNNKKILGQILDSKQIVNKMIKKSQSKKSKNRIRYNRKTNRFQIETILSKNQES